MMPLARVSYSSLAKISRRRAMRGPLWGHERPLRLRRQHVRCTPDSRDLLQSPTRQSRAKLLPYRITPSTEHSLHDGHTRNYRTSTEELVLKINEMPDGSK